MKRAVMCVVCVLVLLLFARGPADPAGASVPAPQGKHSPAMFIRPATPTPEPGAVATPGAPEPPISDIYTDTVYVPAEQQTIGDYQVELWRDQDEENFGSNFNKIVRIIGQDGRQVQIEEVTEIDPLTGQDITGDGNPDVVVRTFTGGAHCCFSTVIYDLGPSLTELLRSLPSNCSGEVKDLDKDGIFEFVTCDDSFAYKFCCFAGSSLPMVIMKYKQGEGYVPASPEFAGAYRGSTAEQIRTARNGQPGDACEWDETNKCSVLPLVLDYLYSGREDEAMEAIDRYYQGDDAETFKKDVLDTVKASELFVTP